MKPADVLRELARPVTDVSLLLALLVFSLLATLASAPGVFGPFGLFGLWLFVLVVPAFYRYLLLVLEARADGRPTPVAGIELFNLAENFWSLTPLILHAAALLGGWWLKANVSDGAAFLFGVAVLAVLPASLGVLAVTRSPVASLNPAAWWRLMRRCGGDYVLAVLVPLAAGVLLWTALAALAPGTFGYFLAMSYEMFLLVTFTGAVLHAHDLTLEVGIAAPTEGRRDPDAELLRERRGVLNHAWGFVSRGNPLGGLQHIEQAVHREPDPAAAWPWYFDTMLEWPSHEAALGLARAWLGWLLSEGREIEALKLMTRCLREDEAFRPRPGDAAAATALARRYGRDDLLPDAGDAVAGR